MMRYISLVGFIALAYSLDQLTSSPVDDTSSLTFDHADLDSGPFVHDDAESDLSLFFHDDAEPDLGPFFDDDDWSTAVPLEPESDTDLSDPIFDETASDSTTDQSGDLSTAYLGEDSFGNTIATAIQCPSTVAPSNGIRSREEQCFGSPANEVQSPELQLQDESIKNQWCSLIPWLGFGNIPVARFTDSMIFPVPPNAVPNALLSLVPLSGFFNVLRGALLTHIIESLVHATDVWCCNAFIPDDSDFVVTPLIEGTGILCIQGTKRSA